MWVGGGGGEEETRGEGTEEKCLCMCWPETRHASHVEGVGLELPPCRDFFLQPGDKRSPRLFCALLTHTHSSRLLSFDSWKPRHLRARRSASRSASKQLCSHVSSAMKNKLRCAGSTERRGREGRGEGGGGGVTARSDGCTHKTKLIKVDTTGLACFLICFQGLIFFFFFAERSSAFTFNSRCLGNLLCCWLGGSYKELSERKAIFIFCAPTRKIIKF